MMRFHTRCYSLKTARAEARRMPPGMWVCCVDILALPFCHIRADPQRSKIAYYCITLLRPISLYQHDRHILVHTYMLRVKNVDTAHRDSYVSAFLSARSSSAPSPSRSSPAVALLESKNVRSDFFSGPSNVPLCTITYVCNNLQSKHQMLRLYIFKKKKRKRMVSGMKKGTNLINFSARSASHPSPSSPSGPYGVGSVSSRTMTGSSACARKARSVSGAVLVEAGSATIDACEFGCTGGPTGRSPSPPPCTLAPEEVAVAAAETATEGVRRLLRRNAVLRRTVMSESGKARNECCLMRHAKETF
jgi:hypothetical protein